MMERIREKKAQERQAKPASQPRTESAFPEDEEGLDDDQPPRPIDAPNAQPGGGRRRKRKKRGGGAGVQANGGQPRQGGSGQPRGNNPPRQPDPLRTGIDALGERGGRNRHRGNRAGKGGGGIDPLRTSFGRIK